MSTRDDNQAPFDWMPPMEQAEPRATQPAPATGREEIRDALEVYAECYDTMTRIGSGMVSTAAVAHDIRRNMVDAVLSILAAQGTQAERAETNSASNSSSNCRAPDSHGLTATRVDRQISPNIDDKAGAALNVLSFPQVEAIIKQVWDEIIDTEATAPDSENAEFAAGKLAGLIAAKTALREKLAAPCAPTSRRTKMSTSNQNEAQRAAFEADALAHDLPIGRYADGRYTGEVESRWQGWCAAMAAADQSKGSSNDSPA